MKNIEKENKPAAGKRNNERSGRTHSDKKAPGKRGAELFRNETEQSDYEDRETGKNSDYFLRANRPGYSQRSQFKEQQGTNRNNKMASVKTDRTDQRKN